MLLQRTWVSVVALLALGGCAAGGPVMDDALAKESQPEALWSDERPYIIGGKKDLGNLYASTVLVSFGERGEATCSGVLMGPRLVLTAGHCVCMEREMTAPVGDAQTVIDGSVCVDAVTVTTKTYGRGEGQAPLCRGRSAHRR